MRLGGDWTPFAHSLVKNISGKRMEKLTLPLFFVLVLDIMSVRRKFFLKF